MVSGSSHSKTALLGLSSELPDELNSAIRRRVGNRLHDIFEAPPNRSASGRLLEALTKLQEAENAQAQQTGNRKEGLA